jgi:hypothetical protein
MAVQFEIRDKTNSSKLIAQPFHFGLGTSGLLILYFEFPMKQMFLILLLYMFFSFGVGGIQ